MDKWVTRNGVISTEEEIHSNDEVAPPQKKRRLLDNKVEQTSNFIKKTLTHYGGAIFEELPEKKNSIFSSLTNEDCLAYTNMTLDQFSLCFLEVEPYLLQPFKKGRKSNVSLKYGVLIYIIRLCTGATYELLASDFSIKDSSTIYRICERIEEPFMASSEKKNFFTYEERRTK